jgi:membrane protein YdbS with pleckstrin-like domain
MGNRVRAARKHFLPLPIESVQTHLGGGEEVLHADGPTFAWFLVHRLLYLLLLGVLAVGFGASLRQGWGIGAAVIAAATVIVLLVLYFQRLTDRYTAYIITNARMIRMAGVVKQSVESIPWVRVTDIHFEQSPLERILGYATLHIQSANENTGLAHMSGIGDPEEFNHHLVDMVVAKQGASVPLGRRSDYNVLPPDRGLGAFRRKRRTEKVPGSQLTVEPATAAAEAASDAAEAAGDAADAAAVAADQAGQAAAAATVPAGPVTEPGSRLRRRRQVEADPALPTDLSDMARVSLSQMEADRLRQDQLLGRDAQEGGGR